MKANLQINELRKQIDQIDRELTALFLRRMKLAQEIGAEKRRLSLPVGDGDREREILDRVKAEAPPELRPALETWFTTLFRLSRAQQGERP